MAEKTSLELAAGLFRNTDKNGNVYYTGKNEAGEEFVMFRNSYWIHTVMDKADKLADEISFRLLATKSHPDYEWLKQKLKDYVKRKNK